LKGWIIFPDIFYLFMYFYAPALRVFENRVVRRIFGPKRDEVTAD
jgi:hypothetical protein